MTVNLSATFKKEQRHYDGLGARTDDFVAAPLATRVVVAVLEVIRITRDIRDGGEETPTVRVRLIEVMDDENAVDARRLLDEVFAKRTGAEPPQDSLFDLIKDDKEKGTGQDPTAGPWPGDADYDAGAEVAPSLDADEAAAQAVAGQPEAAEAEAKPRRRRGGTS